MEALHSLAFASPVSNSLQKPRQLSSVSPEDDEIGVFSEIHLENSFFLSRSLKKSKKYRLVVMMVKPTIQFIQGTDEQTIPDVRLTKSRDGTNGVAIFSFDQPSVFDSSSEVGDITGFYMIDDEGTIQSVDVSAKFVNGKPSGIVARYVMRSPKEWDRFMRFMERYSNENGLQFVKK